MAKRLMVALSNAAEGRDEEYNDWYSNVHIPDICSLEGVLGATRFGSRPTTRRHPTST